MIKSATAAARQAKLEDLPLPAKEGMKKGTCTDAAHAQLQADIAAQ